MSFPVQVMREARTRYQRQRQRQEAEADRLRRAAYDRQPRLRALDLQLRATVAQVMAAAFQQRSDPGNALEKARRDNKAAQEERQALLLEMEIPDYLDLAAPCPRCGGTGWEGQQLCSCLRQICRQVQMEQFASLPGRNVPGFESFRLDLYSTVYDKKFNSTPQEQMRGVLDYCRRWVDGFGPGSASLLMTGGTGLGKTLLSACLGRSLTMKDVGVLYRRAGELLREYESAQFGGQPRPQYYEEVELLILDDLGTEMSTQFTNATLYGLLDGRLLAQRPTIISTNLSVANLQQRYPPQLISRLLGEYETMLFFGDDLRMREEA